LGFIWNWFRFGGCFKVLFVGLKVFGVGLFGVSLKVSLGLV
jgi:hypothetical protein